jgi:hypothetical protein
MVSSSPTTVELTCWSVYAPSNAQESPGWIKGQRFKVVRDERIDRSRAVNLGVSRLRARHWALIDWRFLSRFALIR